MVVLVVFVLAAGFVASDVPLASSPSALAVTAFVARLGLADATGSAVAATSASASVAFAFVANALSPAQVLSVDVDVEHRIANVTVPERMLSLAIGREGQNARLAARLTGWRIDIRSDVSVAEAKAAEDVAAHAPAEPAADVAEASPPAVDAVAGSVSEPVEPAEPAAAASAPEPAPTEAPVAAKKPRARAKKSPSEEVAS